MIPKIQTSAETLTTSGTVTKNPARNGAAATGITAIPPPSPPRSQHAQPRSGTRRTARNPARVTKRRKRLHDQQRRDERHHEADGDLERRGRRSAGPRPPAARETKARRHRRHREEERELGRRGAVEAQQHAADDRGARARHARHERQHLARADGRAPAAAACWSSFDHGRRWAATAPPASITTPPTMKAAGDDGRAVVQDRLHVVGEQRAGHERRHEADAARVSANRRAVGSRRQARARHVSDLGAVQPDRPPGPSRAGSSR